MTGGEGPARRGRLILPTAAAGNGREGDIAAERPCGDDIRNSMLSRGSRICLRGNGATPHWLKRGMTWRSADRADARYDGIGGAGALVPFCRYSTA